MSNRAGINVEGMEEALHAIAALDKAASGKAVVSGLDAIGEIVKAAAIAKCPVGGPRVGRKAGKPHLRDTIDFVLRSYDRSGTHALYVGPLYPQGAHGHLVEYGHAGPRGVQVAAKPFLRPAADETMAQQQAAFREKLVSVVEGAV